MLEKRITRTAAFASLCAFSLMCGMLVNTNRLAGAGLLAPVVNYWWSGFPGNLSDEAYNQQFRQDQWALRVAHYIPWLTYWWNTQKLFPSSSVAGHSTDTLSPQDQELVPKLIQRINHMVSI